MTDLHREFTGQPGRADGSAPGARAVAAGVNAAVQAAVRAADTAAQAAGVLVREVDLLAELEAVYRLYDTIWRPDPKNPPVTTELLRALTKAGNYVAGAFDGDQLVGACVGFFGAPADGTMHSHIAGVSGSARGRSVGFALKVHQRAWAMLRGVSAIEWTFDPVVRRNAYFNLVKLAARPVEYLTNFYGGMRDAINGTGDTDRLLMHWQLDSPAVNAASARAGSARAGSAGAGSAGTASAGDAAAGDAELTAGAEVALGASDRGHPLIGSSGAAGPLGARRLLVAIPADIEGMRVSDPGLAKDWRIAVREVLGTLMAEGATVTGFDRAGWYVVERREEQSMKENSS